MQYIHNKTAFDVVTDVNCINYLCKLYIIYICNIKIVDYERKNSGVSSS